MSVRILVLVASIGATLLHITDLGAADCPAEIRGNRPKIYIADFLVTYGKKDMGQAIGDLIAQKFESDGRFEIVPRSAIHDDMAPALKKNLKAEKYLSLTVDLALAKDADCVVFGRISKKKNQVSFLVRMASVKTGENVRKVDTDVERDKALPFLENVGDSFVSYFTTTAPVAAAETPEPGRRGFFLNLTTGGGYLSASKPVGSDNFSMESFSGHAGLKLGGAVRPDVMLHGSFDGFMGFYPMGKITTSGGDTSASIADLTHTVLFAGGGITLYSETHYFFSATLGLATGSLGYSSVTTSTSGNSGYGFGANLSFGREWLLSKHFGVGIALLGHYSNIPANSVSTNQYYLGMSLSASYNSN